MTMTPHLDTPDILHHQSSTKLLGCNNKSEGALDDAAADVVNDVLLCVSGRPCVFNDSVSFRLIVLTLDRPQSLLKLLNSIDRLELDQGHNASLEIFIDRSSSTGHVDARTIEVARAFRWSLGPTRIHVRERHVGIIGQWIDTWRPPTLHNGH